MLSRSLTRGLVCINAKSVQQLILRASFSSAMPASKPAKKPQQPAVSSFDMSKLLKPLEAEIQFNKENESKQEESSVSKVTQKWSSMLKEQGWTVNSKPESTVVEMSTERGELKVLVRWDAEMVADCINSAMAEQEYDELDEDEANDEILDEDEIDEDEDDFSEPQPFGLTVELHRPSALPGKFIEMELEAIPAPDEASRDQLYVNSIAIRRSQPDSSTEYYSGPQLDSLDEGLREAFEGWAGKNLRHLVPFVTQYSLAKEAEEYDQWLHDIKAIAKQ